MKKRILALTLVLCMLMAAVGCKKDKESAKNVVYDYNDFVVLGSYKNIEVEVDKEDLVITDDELNEQYLSIIEEYGTKVQKKEGKVEKGDDINLDFSGLLDGVAFEISSDRKSGHIQIENNTMHYIVTDFHRYPIHVEIQKDDGWHRILSTKMIFTPSNAIAENETYSLDFSWKDFIGGSLKPGKYRAILFFGDGKSEDFYSTAAEFQVK